MANRPRWRALLSAAALLVAFGSDGAGAASPGTTENTQFLPVWLHPGLGLVRPEAPALLNMPPGWMAGDAMVVLAAGGAWPAGLRDRFVAALLDSGAAVLELNRPRPDQAGVAALREELAAALRAAHEAFGAGIAVLVARGAEGEAALEVAAETMTAGGRRYAAAVRLGAPRPGIVFGSAPEAEAWPARAPLFCDLLANGRAQGEPDIAAECRASLASLR
jgi:hypothetical protein